MRYVLLVPLAVVSFASVVSAQTARLFNPVGDPDIVVARLMTFDRNNDGLVAKEELPDRMRPLLGGEVGRDGALDRSEILAMVAVPRPVMTAIGGGLPRPGGYTFGDQFELSSRSHILDSLDDLRLPESRRAHALAVVRPFIDSLEAQATTTLLNDLEVFISEDQAARLRAVIDRQLAMTPASVAKFDGSKVGQFVIVRPDLALSINQLRLPNWQNALALDALRRFKERLRLGEADRTVLIEYLKGIISDEERENFSAALVRRPLVKAGGVTTAN
jgi:hypothetical protein